MLVPYLPNPNLCKSHYCSQSGQGGRDLPFYSASIRQSGGGLGNIISGAWRYAIPFIPQIRKNLLNVGERALKGGLRFIDDVRKGQTVKQAIATRKRALNNFFGNQEGSGMKRRKKTSKGRGKRSTSGRAVTKRKTKTSKKKKGARKKKPRKTVNDIFG